MRPVRRVVIFQPVNGDHPLSSAPPNQPRAVTPGALSLTELGKPAKTWTLTLHPAHLGLAESPGEPPYVILREEVMKSAMLIEGMNAFAVKAPHKATFKLAPEGTAALAEWIGKPVLAAFYLRRRYAWVLPVAVIWLVASLPMPGNPSAGVEPTRFDPVGFGLGLTLVVSWACAKWRPHPLLFLVDSLWFLMLAGYLVRDILQGRSMAWVLLVVLLLWMVVTGLKHFTRFRGTNVATVKK